MSSSAKNDNKNKDSLIPGKGRTQRLEHTLSAEKKHSSFCLSLHYNKENSYLYVNGTEIIKFKSKDSKVLPYSLYLGNIWDLSVDNTKKTGLNGYVYDFSDDYDAIAVDDILDIYK